MDLPHIPRDLGHHNSLRPLVSIQAIRWHLIVFQDLRHLWDVYPLTRLQRCARPSSYKPRRGGSKRVKVAVQKPTVQKRNRIEFISIEECSGVREHPSRDMNESISHIKDVVRCLSTLSRSKYTHCKPINTDGIGNIILIAFLNERNPKPATLLTIATLLLYVTSKRPGGRCSRVPWEKRVLRVRTTSQHEQSADDVPSR
ncbi:hypothetical protein GWI33_005625 [Rhynchophorus ferrugineus]|uniref:Uncharacterized protein n=1 Tax=Rhynchophorus ferrugineus TaxID=354439 RepID=A0A834IMM1_RHYFE|nr:hypothetical protein GWI33_005625 [Rhynchophorus ferrugineus]